MKYPLTNEALQIAINITTENLRKTCKRYPEHDDLHNHLKDLLEIQVKRANLAIFDNTNGFVE